MCNFEHRKRLPVTSLIDFNCMHPPKFKYRGFGLNIGSDIAIPELYPYDFDRVDVSIEAGPINDPWFENDASPRISQQSDPGLFKLQIPNAGRYLVENGRRLQMEPWGFSNPTAFRMYGLTIAFSACLLQRNLALMHASGIVRSGSVFLFAGASGAGKSTMIARLMQHGHRIFSDDVCVFDGQMDAQGRYLAAPSYPLIKLDAESVDRFFPTMPRNKLWPDAEKFGIGFHDHFHTQPLPVKGIILLSKSPGIRQIQVEKLEGVKAFEALAACTYRPGLIKTLSQQESHARVISGLINQTKVFRILRPTQPDDGSSLMSAIVEWMDQIDQ